MAEFARVIVFSVLYACLPSFICSGKLNRSGLSSGNCPQDAFEVDTTFLFCSHCELNKCSSVSVQNSIHKINSRSFSDFAGLKLKVSERQ